MTKKTKIKRPELDSVWDYRVIHDKTHGTYDVHEVFYSKGKPVSWTVDEISPHGVTRDEMRSSFTMYINDIVFKPIIVVRGDKVIGEEKPLSALLTLEMLPLGSKKKATKIIDGILHSKKKK